MLEKEAGKTEKGSNRKRGLFLARGKSFRLNLGKQSSCCPIWEERRKEEIPRRKKALRLSSPFFGSRFSTTFLAKRSSAVFIASLSFCFSYLLVPVFTNFHASLSGNRKMRKGEKETRIGCAQDRLLWPRCLRVCVVRLHLPFRCPLGSSSTPEEEEKFLSIFSVRWPDQGMSFVLRADIRPAIHIFFCQILGEAYFSSGIPFDPLFSYASSPFSSSSSSSRKGDPVKVTQTIVREREKKGGCVISRPPARAKCGKKNSRV